MNRLEKHIVQGIHDLARELLILGLSKRNGDGKICYKDFKENNLDYNDPVYLIKLGYIKIDEKTKAKYPSCDYKITDEGKKYMKDIEDYLNIGYYEQTSLK